jgi:hypothetical protein
MSTRLRGSYTGFDRRLPGDLDRGPPWGGGDRLAKVSFASSLTSFLTAQLLV